MAVTIVDVARAAGVSKSTASRVLTGSLATSEDARRRVVAAAERLGYRVNRLASGLRAGSSRQLGLVVTNLVNASFQKITTVMQEQAHLAGFQMLLCVTGGDPEREADFLKALQDHSVDGIVIVCTNEGVDQVNGMFESGIPVVGLVRRPRGLRVPTVVGDDRRGAYEATRYLLDLGHRRIAYIGGVPPMSTGRERFAGFTAAHRDAEVTIDPALVRRGPFDPTFGVEATGDLCDSGRDFTALLITNHEAVFGALPELTRRNIGIPDELSLVCQEDVPLFEFWHPPITVLDNGAAELGRVALDVLLSQLTNRGDDGPRPSGVHRVPARLVVRGSCSSVAPPIRVGGIRS